MGSQFERVREAAEQGHADSQFYLGLLYTLGEGVPKDDSKCIELYTKAAEQGHVSAQAMLGFIHRKGLGVPKNHAAAIEFYTKAAEQGHAESQHDLGHIHWKGEFGSVDHVKAYAWASTSNNHGFKPAKEMLEELTKLMNAEAISRAKTLATDISEKIKSNKNN